MAWRSARVLSFAILLIAGVTLGGTVLFAQAQGGEADPDLMKAECPGGKDWDSSGSSCRVGIIFDYIRSPIQATPIEKFRTMSAKRRGFDSWTNKLHDVK